MWTSDIFEILPDTGVLKSIVSMDRESVSEYSLTIQAVDHGNPLSMRTTIVLSIHVTDENDNSPEFEQSIYNINVRERASLSTVVIWIQAQDEDEGRNAEISYTLIGSGEVNKYFSLNRNTGE